MSNQRFPYERSRWRSGERDTARQWHEALERVGVESVRIRLTQVNCSSASAVSHDTQSDDRPGAHLSITRQLETLRCRKPTAAGNGGGFAMVL
jgi:hypothetical protein